ncbi:hypothetical protein ACISK3_04095 [Morganella morganii]|nr:hypothetical protein [Morganella morganii]
MKRHVFNKFFDSKKIEESILTICRSEEPLISVLTLHLTCESFLEAFISGKLDIEDLFASRPKNHDDVSFRMSFEHKNKLAQRLGMPRAAYEALSELNQIRNQFAHRLLHAEIPSKTINKIIELIDSFKGTETEIKLNDEGVTYRPVDGDNQFTYKMSDPGTPETIKLCIAYFSMFRRVAMGLSH